MLIKESIKYVVADYESYSFLRTFGNGRYSFVEDIAQATKTNSSELANKFMENYCRNTGYDKPMMVLPINVIYESVEN